MPTPLYLRPATRSSVFSIGIPDVYIGGLTADTLGTIATELPQVLAKIDKYLAEAGSAKTHICHLNINLSLEGCYPQAYTAVCCDTPSLLMPSQAMAAGLMSDTIGSFKPIYEAWAPDPRPPRTIQWTMLDRVGAHVEISVIASRKEQ